MEEPTKDVIRPTDAEAIRMAKTLLRSARHGALATLDPSDGSPIATRVAVATDIDGAPLILVSALSAHTEALVADARCSLLVGEPGKGDPLAHPRMTIACRGEKLERETREAVRAARRYLNRHPKAKLYAGFGDFAFFRLEPLSASLNGGFGRAFRLTDTDLRTRSPANAALADAEQDALDHMNADHGGAIGVYARAFAGAKRDDGWVMTGLDAEGIDLARGDEARRVFFPHRLENAGDLRAALVELARTGRERLRLQGT